jgi:hypothetical protein
MSQGILERIETKLDLLIAKMGNQSVISFDPTKGSDATTDDLISGKIHSVVDTELLGKGFDAPTVSDDPYAGVDEDGVRWDERIHSKAAEPKAKTGTKKGCWKRRKGITDDLYESVLAELQQQTGELSQEEISAVIKGPFFWKDSVTGVFNTVETRAEMDKLLTIPSTKELTRAEFDALVTGESKPKVPGVPQVPGVPKVPGVPQVPKAPVELAAKPAVLMLIKELSDKYDIEPKDADQLMVEITGIDTVAKLDETQLNDFKSELDAWKLSLEKSQECISAINEIAKGINQEQAAIDGVLSILEPHDAEQIGHVHYSGISGVSETLAEYLKNWQGA